MPFKKLCTKKSAATVAPPKVYQAAFPKQQNKIHLLKDAIQAKKGAMLDKDKQIEALQLEVETLKRDATSKNSQMEYLRQLEQTLRLEILLSQNPQEGLQQELTKARHHVELLKQVIGKAPSALVAQVQSMENQMKALETELAGKEVAWKEAVQGRTAAQLVSFACVGMAANKAAFKLVCWHCAESAHKWGIANERSMVFVFALSVYTLAPVEASSSCNCL